MELRPHHLRHQPETRQRVARSQLIAAVFTKKKGCRGDDTLGNAAIEGVRGRVMAAQS